MSAGIVLAIAVCALCAAVFGAILKRGGKEYAILLSTAAAVLITACVAEELAPLVQQITALSVAGGLPGLCLSVLLKAAGLTILGQLAVHLCRDAGESVLAYGVELAAQTAILTVAIPLFTRLLEYLGEILQP